MVLVWGTEEAFIQHGFRTALVLDVQDIYIWLQYGYRMVSVCGTEEAFIQKGFRTALEL